MFFRKKQIRMIEYDRENEEAVLRCSICTGEQTAGFRNLKTGHFRDYMLIRNDGELRDFCARCGCENIKIIY